HTRELQAVYQPLLDFYKRYASTEAGTPMETVLATVERALNAQHPKARYVVGRSATWRARLNYLPTRWREALVLRAILSNATRPG
ncbi:hypothetical protein, partial [Bradyrhizobium canariense]|uniref:hypothetical protein n=1 Tax=Bradyrhizobium canariense TaxID=255045 RepID=UPI000A23EAB8